MFKILRKKIGIIGFGNMGAAIAKGLKDKYRIYVFDKDREKIKDALGLKVADSIRDLAVNVRVIILAVKPQDFETVLNEIKGLIDRKLIISIAAGIRTTDIEKYLGDIRVVRVMPNLPAKIKEGMICLYKGKYATGEDVSLTEEIFSHLGKILALDSEDMLNAATAVSGSGPGFLYDLIENKSMEEIKEFTIKFFIPSLTASASNLGFTPQQAKLLAETTAKGSIVYLEREKLSPSQAKAQVVSKKGTTEAGLEVLQRGGTLEEAVRAAEKRAEELSREWL